MLKRHMQKMHPNATNKYSALVSTGTDPAAAAVAAMEEQDAASKKRSSAFQQGPTKEENRLTQEILLFAWAVEKGISFAAVESDYFKQYHKLMNWTQPPNRDRFGGVLLEQAYTVCVERLKSELAQVDFFAITTDAWTSEVKEKFVAVTVHFIPLPSYGLKSHVLAVIPLNESHTWQAMTRAIALRIANALPNDAVLVSTVTDNGSNFVKLARSLHSNLEIAAVDDDIDSWDEPAAPREGGEADPTATWRCVAHRAQLAVDDAIGEIGEPLRGAIDAARRVVRFVRASSSRRANLVKVQMAANRAVLVPQLDVPTRWSSMWMMLSSFVKLDDDFSAMALAGMLERDDEDDAEAVVLPTRQQVRQVTHIVAALEPLADFVRLAEGEYYCTLAVVPVLLRRCFNIIGANPPMTSSELRSFKRILLAKVTTRLGYILETPNLALAAAALHPAYGHLKYVDPAVRDAMWAELAVWVEEFPQPGSADEDEDGMPMPQRQPSAVEIRGQLSNVRTVFENAMAPPAGEENVTLMRDNINALAWWKKNLDRAISPAINHLARIVHCIPATSAPSERVFSNSGLLATASRAALHADKVEMCTIIRGVMRTFASAEEFASVVKAHALRVKDEEARRQAKRLRLRAAHENRARAGDGENENQVPQP